MQHNLDKINGYRKQNGLPDYTLDHGLSDFAFAGSTELTQDHISHKHAMDCATFAGSENQSGPNGFQGGAAGYTEMTEIDWLIDHMYAAGPGEGHHDNIVSSRWTRLGVGLIEDSAGTLYLTNDFAP